MMDIQNVAIQAFDTVKQQIEFPIPTELRAQNLQRNQFNRSVEEIMDHWANRFAGLGSIELAGTLKNSTSSDWASSGLSRDADKPNDVH